MSSFHLAHQWFVHLHVGLGKKKEENVGLVTLVLCLQTTPNGIKSTMPMVPH
jgi:hypothetical protein